MTDPLASLRTALSDRYAVERELGHGGMATVYLATDLKHDRAVAVKVMKPDVAAAMGRERFLREIRVAAKLQHPNILPVYDSGEADGSLYYVMPFVEGESLRDRLDREHQLSMEEAIQIAREVADALTYAHSHDVVHRDIKPENILIEGSHAVLADFGIARAITAGGGDKITKTGLAIGTPAYMSPEQASAGEVDRRSDIYSLGCVLYEMLAGMPPFTGPTAQAVMARHSLDSVPRLKIFRELVPDALEDAIMRALAKVPADRFATAYEFAQALTASGAVTPLARTLSREVPGVRPTPRVARRVLWAAIVVAVLGSAWTAWRLMAGTGQAEGGTGMDPKRVAVLYFADESRDSSLTYLADGLTEALIEELAHVRGLDVISRNGVAPYRGADLSRDSIARALGAGTLVEGAVEQVGSRLRATVRLVDGASGADLRRQGFELPAGDHLAIRDSLAQRAALFLRERLGEAVQLRQQRAGTRSTTAWTLVQQAERMRKEAESLFRADDAAGAVRALERADSTLALAEAADRGWTEPVVLRGVVARQRSRLAPRLDAPAWIDSGLAHAAQAVALAPNDPKAIALRGTLRYAKWGHRVVADPAAQRNLLDDAKSDLETATAADPSLAAANLTLSSLLYQVDDVPGALLRARQAYEEDAYISNADGALDRLFWGSIDLEQFSEARRWCAEGARRFPNDRRFVSCQLWLMVTPAVQPDARRAWELVGTLEQLTPAPQRAFTKAEGLLLVAGALGRAGLADSARRVMLRARDMASHDIDPEQNLLGREAYVRTLIGDHDEAIDLLKRFAAANPGHPFAETAGTVWWWRELRSHPRWREISQPGR